MTKVTVYVQINNLTTLSVAPFGPVWANTSSAISLPNTSQHKNLKFSEKLTHDAVNATRGWCSYSLFS